MPFTRNENKIVSIISNANLNSIRDGSKSTWKQNISRILGEQGKTNTQLTLFNSISNNLSSLDVSDSVELLMTDSPPILEQGTEKVDTPIARFITGGSDNKKVLESFKNLKYMKLIDGATGENRTHDLTLTKGALYHWATVAQKRLLKDTYKFTKSQEY